MTSSIGILHPGHMGTALGSILLENGHRIFWASEGRSEASYHRAQEVGFADLATLSKVAETCEIIVSSCPPHAALDVAKAAFAAGFTGIFIDTNAISPGSAAEIARNIEIADGRYIDGSVIGPPPTAKQSSRLYLSGIGATEAARLFRHEYLDVKVLKEGPFAASAIKMCFGGYTKGHAALILLLNGMAESLGVREPLLDEWRESIPELAERSEVGLPGAVRKAWRFVGEMQEVAKTAEEVGLPCGVHQGVSEVYALLEAFRDIENPPIGAELAMFMKNSAHERRPGTPHLDLGSDQ